MKQKTNKSLSTSSKSSRGAQVPGAYEGIGAAITAELMIDFWFGIGVILSVKTVQSLEYCIEELICRK